MSVVLLARRKTMSSCSRRSHMATSITANVRSGLVTSHVLTDLGSSISNCRLMLLVRSTIKKEMIC
jgi:hypothetical protein